MTIRDWDRFRESLPDWSMLDGCFGGRIRPTDIDGAVERFGRVLFLEHKGGGAQVGTAQRILFETLAQTGHAVIAFWTADGDTCNVVRLQKWHRGKCGCVDPATLDDLRAACAKWYVYAQKHRADVWRKEAA